jgi:hypothetical protein
MATKNGPQVNVAVDFSTSRGFGPMGVGLPTNFLTFDRQMVCGTIAALYHNPIDDDGERRTTKHSRAMTQLALYAGGFSVTLTKQQFRQLERAVRGYASAMEAPTYITTNNLGFARYVLRHAANRAKVEKLIG